MKTKIQDFIMEHIVTAAMIIIIPMLMIPFPAIVIEVLLGIEVAAAIGILIYSLTNHKVAMPKLVLIFSLWSLAINIGITRFSLTSYESGLKIPVIDFVSNILNGKSYIIGFIIAIILLSVQILIISRGCCRFTEVSARFILDSMNQKLFDIDNKLNRGIMDKTEAEKLKTVLMKEVDYYSCMDGAAKFLSGNAKASIVITLVNLACGILIEILRCKLPLNQAVESAAFITSGNAIVFTLPSIIVSFAAVLNIIGDFNKIKNESESPVNREEIEKIVNEDFRLEVAYNLIPLVDSELEAPLISAIQILRKELPQLPKIRIVDNMELDEYEYKIHWKLMGIKFKVSKDDSLENLVEQIIKDIRTVYETEVKDE